jgi:Kef-type K+ transport system membrane component KefB
VLTDDDSAWLGVVLVYTAAVIAPLITDRLRLPTPVVEIVLGIVLGPSLLGVVAGTDLTELFSQLGLTMLFFLAGYELDLSRIKGRPLNLAALGWVVSLAVGIGLSMLVLFDVRAGVLVGVAVSTTALGTILPMVRDAGLLEHRLGWHIMAIGAVGEFAPIVVIAVFFSGDGHDSIDPALLGAGVLAVGVAVLAMRPRSGKVSRMLSQTLGTSVQFAVRLAFLAIVFLVWVAYEVGVDIILGAFAAGIVIRGLISTISQEEGEVVASKLDAVGYGVLIPFFFVMTGVDFQVKALVGSTSALVLLPVFLALFLVARAVVTWFTHRTAVPDRGERRVLSLFAATQLPLVVVLANIGQTAKVISAGTATAMIGAGMLSVLLFPLMALWRKTPSTVPAAEVR